jgi:hypothetical protein
MGVIPVGAARVIVRDGDDDVVAPPRLHAAEDVVGIAAGADVQPMDVDVRGVEVMGQVGIERHLRPVRRQLVAQTDAEDIARLHPQGRTGDRSLIRTHREAVSADVDVGVLDMELGGELAVDGTAHLGLDELRGLPRRRLEQSYAAVRLHVRLVAGRWRRISAGHGASPRAGQEERATRACAGGKETPAGEHDLETIRRYGAVRHGPSFSSLNVRRADVLATACERTATPRAEPRLQARGLRSTRDRQSACGPAANPLWSAVEMIHFDSCACQAFERRKPMPLRA